MAGPKKSTAKSGGNGIEIDGDTVKKSQSLLEIISQTKNAATALIDFRDKYAELLGHNDKSQLNLIISALDFVYDFGRKQTARVSPVGYLLPAYDWRKREGAGGTMLSPKMQVSEATASLKEFVRSCEDLGVSKPVKRRPAIVVDSSPKTKKPRRSARVTPERADREIATLLCGQPPFPDKLWTKEALVEAMQKTEGTGHTFAFIKKVLDVGKTHYKTHGAMYRMYKRYKANNTIPSGPGRPFSIGVAELENNVTTTLTSRSSSSSAFTLGSLKESIASKKKFEAKANGLDPDGVACGISDRTAKVLMTAAAMGLPGTYFTKKKLQIKSASRFVAEHSLFMAYAFATTAISTGFIPGRTPAHLVGKFRPDRLSPSARETMDWVKLAWGEDEIYPVDPNLLLSTDDTVLFVFQGCKNAKDDWEWKIIDSTNGDPSVRSDFQVGEDAEHTGRLRVRLTFTFTASGLAAPPYIAVSGLTDEELSPKLCPDGILAAEVPNLCKGGDDLFNNGSGWLVFLRADKKDRDDPEKAALSIANKKFIHYNDDVLVPFIRRIREKLGWRKGQPVPESLRASSWFDGDIGQLQTMLFEAREALDEYERIVRNKHSAAATGTQQPCDLSPVFRILRRLQNNSTATADTACGLADDIRDLFALHLRTNGLELNHRKKKALVDFLLCLPEMLESAMKKSHIKKGFVEAGMIDEETGMVPVFDRLMGTCKRWVSGSKHIGVSMEDKQRMKEQFPNLFGKQCDAGAITYPDMKASGLPLGEHYLFDCDSISGLCYYS